MFNFPHWTTYFAIGLIIGTISTMFTMFGDYPGLSILFISIGLLMCYGYDWLQQRAVRKEIEEFVREVKDDKAGKS